jgi:hypothetical protein
MVDFLQTSQGTERAIARGAGPGAWRKSGSAVGLFMVVVLAHWAEHVLQAAQAFILGWERANSRGALGHVWPWLVSSESLHYAYAVAMLAGLALLRDAFTGRARTWWLVALAIQVWHHLEHALLLAQAVLDDSFFGQTAPTSLVQLVIPRIELHLFYNAVVFTPMVVAVYLQFFDRPPRQPSALAPRLR